MAAGPDNPSIGSNFFDRNESAIQIHAVAWRGCRVRIGQTGRAQQARKRPSRAAFRPIPWTFDEVLGIVADRGDDPAVVGQTFKGWPDQPRIRVNDMCATVPW